MRSGWTLGAVCAVLLAAMVVARAQETDGAEKKAARQARLVLPWTKLSNLTDEQKTQIREIHGKALAEIKAIRQREEAEIMALLTEDQKTQLAALKEAQAAERKAKAAEAKDEKKAPAGQ